MDFLEIKISDFYPTMFKPTEIHNHPLYLTSKVTPVRKRGSKSANVTKCNMNKSLTYYAVSEHFCPRLSYSHLQWWLFNDKIIRITWSKATSQGYLSTSFVFIEKFISKMVACFLLSMNTLINWLFSAATNIFMTRNIIWACE